MANNVEYEIASAGCTSNAYRRGEDGDDGSDDNGDNDDDHVSGNSIKSQVQLNTPSTTMMTRDFYYSHNEWKRLTERV